LIEWVLPVIEKRRILAFGLGNHPKPAIHNHLKTGQR